MVLNHNTAFFKNDKTSYFFHPTLFIFGNTDRHSQTGCQIEENWVRKLKVIVFLKMQYSDKGSKKLIEKAVIPKQINF